MLAKFLAGLLLLTALASAQEEALGPNGQPRPEPYSFSYTAGSEGALSTHQETGDGSGRITGVYTIAGPDGRERRVEYEADANGYRAVVKTNEIGTKPGDSGDTRWQNDNQTPEGSGNSARVAQQQEQIPSANQNDAVALAPNSADSQQTLENLDDISDQPPQQQIVQVQQPQAPLASSFRPLAPPQPIGQLILDVPRPQQQILVQQAPLPQPQQQQQILFQAPRPQPIFVQSPRQQPVYAPIPQAVQVQLAPQPIQVQLAPQPLPAINFAPRQPVVIAQQQQQQEVEVEQQQQQQAPNEEIETDNQAQPAPQKVQEVVQVIEHAPVQQVQLVQTPVIQEVQEAPLPIAAPIEIQRVQPVPQAIVAAPQPVIVQSSIKGGGIKGVAKPAPVQWQPQLIAPQPVLPQAQFVQPQLIRQPVPVLPVQTIKAPSPVPNQAAKGKVEVISFKEQPTEETPAASAGLEASPAPEQAPEPAPLVTEAAPAIKVGRLAFGRARFGAPGGVKGGVKSAAPAPLPQPVVVVQPAPVPVPVAAPVQLQQAPIQANPQFVSFGTRLGTKSG